MSDAENGKKVRPALLPSRAGKDDRTIPPRRRDAKLAAPSPEDEEEQAASPKSSLSLILILGGIGVGGVVLLLCGGIGIYFFTRKPADSSSEVVEAPAPNDAGKVNPPPPPRHTRPARPAPTVYNPLPTVPVQPPPVQPPTTPVEPPPPMTPDPVVADGFTYKPDPLPAELTPPEKPKGTVPIGGKYNNYVVLFPAFATPFVSVRTRIAAENYKDIYEIYDLRILKRIGALSPSTDFRRPHLSPDGKSIADYNYLEGKMKLRVLSIDGTKHDIQVPDYFGDTHFDRIVTWVLNGLNMDIQVWDIKTAAEICKFSYAYNPGSIKCDPAISAGGKYVACYNSKWKAIQLVDLSNGQKVGQLPYVKNADSVQAMAFSVDGQSLAALHRTDSGEHLTAWDLNSGKRKFQRTVDGKDEYSWVALTEGRGLEGLCDSSGWLVCGRKLVDGQTGAPYWKLDVWNPKLIGPARSRIFGGGTHAHLAGTLDNCLFTFDPLPTDAIAAALQAARAEKTPDAKVDP
jgi:hypothetical protein